MTSNATPRPFSSGRIMITATASSTIHRVDAMAGLLRHLQCDWGDCCEDDAAENELSLKEGFRLFSVYHDRNGVKFWIITEADRSVTTILLPEDY